VRGSHLFTCLLWVCASIACGCEVLDEAGVPGMDRFIDRAAAQKETAKHRELFATEGNPESFRWLLANRIEQGMSVSDINTLFGISGERVVNDGWLKNKQGGRYRQGDVSFKWGSTSDGKSVYLIFRDDHLVNFNPDEYLEDGVL
jgi:hypothetical protein